MLEISSHGHHISIGPTTMMPLHSDQMHHATFFKPTYAWLLTEKDNSEKIMTVQFST